VLDTGNPGSVDERAVLPDTLRPFFERNHEECAYST
jgi:hypothetical protein